MKTSRSLSLRIAIVATIASVALLSACTATFGRSTATTGAAASASLTSTGSNGSSSTTASATATASDPVVQVIKVVEPAVVQVATTTTANDPFFGSSTRQGTGTGFIVDASGLIFTNDHVIEGASSIEVTLNDGRSFAATVVDTDSARDLALLKIDASGLPTVRLGRSSSLQLGQSVVAIGYALGLSGGPSVTSGIISSLERTVQAQDPAAAGGVRTYRDVLQTSAAINPGNSGGPLVDLSGAVVGINTAGVSSAENIGFAISIDAARSFIGAAISQA